MTTSNIPTIVNRYPEFFGPRLRVLVEERIHTDAAPICSDETCACWEALLGDNAWKQQNVREINEAIELQKFHGTRNVRNAYGFRVIKARTIKGQLQVKLLDGTWHDAESVTID